MSRTYPATGIILKGMPLGESDRLVTLLSPEYGLLRAAVPGARKHKSLLRGRTELFVVNQFLFAQGRSLDRIIQAETLESFPGLSRDLSKLSAGQYLAEIVLSFALSAQPQDELYYLLLEHLKRIEQLERTTAIYALLSQAIYHFLAIGGLCPQLHACCLSQTQILPNLDDPSWRVGFSFEAGGLIELNPCDLYLLSEKDAKKDAIFSERITAVMPPINTKLGSVELTLLQQLGNSFLSTSLSSLDTPISMDGAWARIERTLRDYAQYHLGQQFKSAVFIDSLALLDF